MYNWTLGKISSCKEKQEMSSKLKTDLPSCSIYKHDAIDIPDLSSMLDTSHMNFVIDLAQSLCGSVVEHQSMESKASRLNYLWVLRIFSLSHACGKTKSIFLYFFTELKTYHLSYSMFPTLCEKCVGSLL